MNGRLLAQRLLALFVAGWALFGFPLVPLWPGALGLFAVWAALIGVLAWWMERDAGADDEDG